MRCVAAIDPGKDKSGFAVLDAGGSTLFQCIVPTAAIPEQLTPQLLLHQPECLVLGNGTTSRQMQQCLQQAWPELPIVIVDEYRTTQAAREEYWKKYPPKGWRRLLPVTMQVPPVPVDDFAAVLLARRYVLRGKQEETV